MKLFGIFYVLVTVHCGTPRHIAPIVRILFSPTAAPWEVWPTMLAALATAVAMNRRIAVVGAALLRVHGSPVPKDQPEVCAALPLVPMAVICRASDSVCMAHASCSRLGT